MFQALNFIQSNVSMTIKIKILIDKSYYNTFVLISLYNKNMIILFLGLWFQYKIVLKKKCSENAYLSLI